MQVKGSIIQLYLRTNHTPMEQLKFTLLLAACFAFCRVTAQDPYFVQGIHADKAHVCRGEQVLLSARVAHTSYYEFQFREPDSGDWIRLSSGHTDTTASLIEHLFYSVSSSLTVRVLLRNARSEITGGALDVYVHQPVFDIQPRDLVQCNGGEVIFRASAAGAPSYQWESSTNGTDFTSLSVTAKFKDVQTPHLKVTGIINGHHGQLFRCRVKDAYQCEALSETAVLSVNQLSTTVSPTTSTPFCEGDTARFFPASLTGRAVSFQWALRKDGQASYTDLPESERFTGTTGQHLRVNGILPGENSYRIKAGFAALIQNLSGHTDSTVCYLQGTRANYTIHPRPAPPAPLDSLENCGPGSFLISGTENYYWYEDTLRPPLQQRSATFQTPELTASQVYYYSVKDSRSCESYRDSVKVLIRPVPAPLLSLPEGICPDETRVPLSITGEIPLYFFVHSPDLDGFITIDSLPATPQAEIPLPAARNAGSYTLKVHSINRYCSSDTTELRLNIYPATRIHPTLEDIRVCETEKIQVSPGFEAQEPVNIAWYQNGTMLENLTEDSLLILSADPSHTGEYTVKVSGQCGEEISAPFHVEILPVPHILTQPKDTALCENSSAVFRISTEGSSPLSYQWFINDRAVPGNTDTLRIPNVNPALNQARIVCKISSSCLREVVSDTAILTVRPLPPPPVIGDTLVFCTSDPVIRLAKENTPVLNWFDPGGDLLPSSEIKVADAGDRVFSVSQTDSHGCESPEKPFLILVYPSFTVTAVSDREEICLTGNFNRKVQLGTFTNTPDPVSFQLIYENHILESNTTGHFSVHQPGLYVIRGLQKHCSASDSLRVYPAGTDLLTAPVVPDTETCFGGSTLLEAVSAYTGGTFYWWTNSEEVSGFATGREVQVNNIASDTTFFVSYGMQNGHLFCESPRGKAEVRLLNFSRLTAGRIASDTSVHCAGYNPPPITSPEAPAGGSKTQWQFSESCENPLWLDIPDASALVYNPGTLQVTTCFRRKAFNECDTVFSNAVTFHIVPDPSVTISAEYDTIYPGDSLTLRATLQGGAGNCTVRWQVNRVSAALSNPNWTDAGTGEIFYFTHPGSDESVHFRARVNCDLSSCNLATSNVVSARFLPSVPPSDTLHILSQTQEMVNCYGSVSYLHVEAEGEGTINYRWQRMLPGDSLFTDLTENNSLSGVQSASLRIGSTGNMESPHLARFRCIITDASRQLASQEVPLTVNRLLGNLPNQTLCNGNDLFADLGITHTITGSPLQFGWQHRPGTGHPWVALKDTGKVSGSATPYLAVRDLPVLEQVQYRCAVTFSSHNGTCVETTDLMTLKTGAYPEKPADMDKEICQDEKLEKITLYPPGNLKTVWYHLHTSEALTRQPEISTARPGDYFMQYAWISDKKCESPRALIRVTVHPSPPAPVNTTPPIYDDAEWLAFSAEGENLKWYRTKTLKSYELYPPVFSSTGKKSYYVTQTSSQGCESERLLIQSEIRPVFRITSQPQDQVNCEGNTITFSVRITGGQSVTYQWQREYYGVFGDITGATQRDYRITDAGAGPDTTGARYRCIIRSEEKQLISEPATLYINRLKASLPDMDLCPGGSVDFSRYRDSISGVMIKMEWQERKGNIFSTIFEASALTDTFTPDTVTTGPFRLRITFQSPGGTCVRNSNNIRVKAHSLPDLAGIDSLQICEGTSIASLLKILPENLLLLDSDSTRPDSARLLQPGDEYRIAASHIAGCTGPFRAFTPVILPKPRFSPADTLLRVCRFSSLADTVFNKGKTWWQLPGGEWSPQPDIGTLQEARYRVACKIQGENGCFSDSAKVTLEIISCYFAGQVDTCMDFPSPALSPDTWHYSHLENGEIVAAVHPQGMHTGPMNLKLSATRESSWNDPSGNRFYPRSLSFNTTRKLRSKIKIRCYMSADEVNNYTGEGSLLLLHREKFPEECVPGSGPLWLKDIVHWDSTADKRYLCFEWETEHTGQYFLWKSRLPSGQITVETESRRFPLVSVRNLQPMPSGQYQIQKSRDGISWQPWRSGIHGETEDISPFGPETYYRLIFDFGNNIMAELGTAQATISGEYPECVLLENPVGQGQSIRLYFPGLQKNHTRLVTVQGTEIPLLQITENGEHYRISPVNTLTKGSYYLKTQNRSGISCTKKIFIY